MFISIILFLYFNFIRNSAEDYYKASSDIQDEDFPHSKYIAYNNIRSDNRNLIKNTSLGYTINFPSIQPILDLISEWGSEIGTFLTTKINEFLVDIHTLIQNATAIEAPQIAQIVSNGNNDIKVGLNNIFGVPNLLLQKNYYTKRNKCKIFIY